MAYTDFTLDTVTTKLGVRLGTGRLFPQLKPATVPAWLPEQLQRTRAVMPLVSEKARSEVLVAPILAACRETVATPLAIYSGVRLDVEPSLGLMGECDFVLARTLPLPTLRAPLLAVVEAKKADIELGLGQALAQMVGVRIFNERAGEPARPAFGCVTTGQIWQFLRLDGDDAVIDTEQYYLDNLPGILGVLEIILTA